MTAIEINAEIYRSLGYLSKNENYLRKAMNELKKLASQMRRESRKDQQEKIVVKDIPMSIDKYVGIVSSNPSDDKAKIEEYLTEKYDL